MGDLEKEMNRPNDFLDGFVDSLWKLGFPCRRSGKNRVDIISPKVISKHKITQDPTSINQKLSDGHTRD